MIVESRGGIMPIIIKFEIPCEKVRLKINNDESNVLVVRDYKGTDMEAKLN